MALVKTGNGKAQGCRLSTDDMPSVYGQAIKSPTPPPDRIDLYLSLAPPGSSPKARVKYARDLMKLRDLEFFAEAEKPAG